MGATSTKSRDKTLNDTSKIHQKQYIIKKEGEKILILFKLTNSTANYPIHKHFRES